MALSAQEDKIMLNSISSKHLCFVVNEVDYRHADCRGSSIPTNYHLKSVPLLDMFSVDSGSLVPQQLQSWHEERMLTGIGLLLPAKADPLYVVFHGATTKASADVPPRERTFTMQKYPFRREQSHVELGPMTQTKPSKSKLPDFNPIVVEINERIYVYCSLYYPVSDRVSDPEERAVFQVYDPVEDKWTTLKAPPVTCYYSGYSYVVLGNKFYLSSMSGSSVFCTDTLEWGPSKLFGELSNYDHESEYDVYYLDNYKSSRELFKDDAKLSQGCPFPFGSNLLVVYEDFLLCTTTFEGRTDVVAYKVSSDGIAQRQKSPSTQQELSLLTVFDEREINIEEEHTLLFDEGYGIVRSCYFTDLGDGHICVMVTRPDYFYDFAISPLVKCILFRVSKSPDGQTLSCTDVRESTLRFADEREEMGRLNAYSVSNLFAC